MVGFKVSFSSRSNFFYQIYFSERNFLDFMMNRIFRLCIDKMQKNILSCETFVPQAYRELAANCYSW